MTADAPTILAASAGFVPDRRGGVRPGPIHRFAADLAGANPARAGANPARHGANPARPGAAQTRICLLAQATGDPAGLIATCYAAFAGTEFAMSHLQLFPMPNVADVRAHLLGQDVIWVEGGSVANLCAVWRAHGLDEILYEAWRAGVVLAGISAGSICWHRGGCTDSYGPELRGFTDGLGWLPYSNGVHYDNESQRRPTMHRLIGDGTLPDGYATDDGAALLYRDTRLVEAVAGRPGPRAYELRRAADGTVIETALPTRVLGYEA
ncbi:peptidase E [Paractinoplanes rishiriensis]|uniref:Peptidase E n=1 Tax=Paractinoplanes rishiriensis TaxID=1050105 RepID=A0A919MXU9_9ACTN|nr:peptidase E [Actinoplanes rishiriensis]GIE99054.1 peptidase E [Actinoplanes rishiriensis]